MKYMKAIDGKELNTAKGGNIVRELCFCLIKILLDTKWEEFKVKIIN